MRVRFPLINFSGVFKMRTFIFYISFLFVFNELYSKSNPSERVDTHVMTLCKIEGNKLYFLELMWPFLMTENFQTLLKEKKIRFSENAKSYELKLPAKVKITFEIPKKFYEDRPTPHKVLYIEYIEPVNIDIIPEWEENFEIPSQTE